MSLLGCVMCVWSCTANKAPPDMSCLSRCAQNFGGQKSCLFEAVYHSPPFGMLLITSARIDCPSNEAFLGVAAAWRNCVQPESAVLEPNIFTYHLFSRNSK